jgi:hypothetical protein
VVVVVVQVFSIPATWINHREVQWLLAGHRNKREQVAMAIGREHWLLDELLEPLVLVSSDTTLDG